MGCGDALQGFGHPAFDSEFVGGALFIPIFFIHLGLLLNLSDLAASVNTLDFTVLMLVGALGCKALAALCAGRWFGYNNNQILLMWSLAMPKVAATLATATAAIVASPRLAIVI